jgi:ubiquinone/menaquinone biosynthesis C-methylase UbiE
MNVVPLARGRVLEVGFGSGLNLPYYDPHSVTGVWGLDPSPDMTRMASGRLKDAALDVEIIHGRAEAIPLDDACVDTVLVTYTLCTIPDAPAALREMARVLAPGGRLLFCEHGMAPDRGVRRWQRLLGPAWRRLGGGCNLDRDIPGLIRDAGFTITGMHASYIPGWRPASFNFRGAAVIP